MGNMFLSMLNLKHEGNRQKDNPDSALEAMSHTGAYVFMTLT